MGISTVPTIFVNGRVVAGATDADKIRTVIQEELGTGQ
jgi:protein-disulfide isomerase